MSDRKVRPNGKAVAYLVNPQTTGLVLLVIVADTLGPDFLAWDPETIRMEVNQSFGVQLPDSNFNRLMAAIELATSDSFYVNLPDFIRICNALYNGTFDPRVFDPADAGEIAWGITEGLIIWPPEDGRKPFAPKILEYIGRTVHDEGIMIPPDILRLGVTGEGDLWDQVQATYSDDPAMFAAIYEMERGKTEAINQLVKERLGQLLEQLESLELQNGDTKAVVKKLLAQLRREESEGQEMRPAIPSE